jgi:hypothetical protein
MRLKNLVPSKGLEPPHPCEYMDLNHARLPIPPRWHSELQCSGGREAAVRKINFVILQACRRVSNMASDHRDSYL